MAHALGASCSNSVDASAHSPLRPGARSNAHARCAASLHKCAASGPAEQPLAQQVQRAQRAGKAASELVALALGRLIKANEWRLRQMDGQQHPVASVEVLPPATFERVNENTLVLLDPRHDRLIYLMALESQLPTNELAIQLTKLLIASNPSHRYTYAVDEELWDGLQEEQAGTAERFDSIERAAKFADYYPGREGACTVHSRVRHFKTLRSHLKGVSERVRQRRGMFICPHADGKLQRDTLIRMGIFMMYKAYLVESRVMPLSSDIEFRRASARDMPVWFGGPGAHYLADHGVDPGPDLDSIPVNNPYLAQLEEALSDEDETDDLEAEDGEDFEILEDEEEDEEENQEAEEQDGMAHGSDDDDEAEAVEEQEGVRGAARGSLAEEAEPPPAVAERPPRELHEGSLEYVEAYRDAVRALALALTAADLDEDGKKKDGKGKRPRGFSREEPPRDGAEEEEPEVDHNLYMPMAWDAASTTDPPKWYMFARVRWGEERREELKTRKGLEEQFTTAYQTSNHMLRLEALFAQEAAEPGTAAAAAASSTGDSGGASTSGGSAAVVPVAATSAASSLQLPTAKGAKFRERKLQEQQQQQQEQQQERHASQAPLTAPQATSSLPPVQIPPMPPVPEEFANVPMRLNDGRVVTLQHYMENVHNDVWAERLQRELMAQEAASASSSSSSGSAADPHNKCNGPHAGPLPAQGQAAGVAGPSQQPQLGSGVSGPAGELSAHQLADVAVGASDEAEEEEEAEGAEQGEDQGPSAAARAEEVVRSGRVTRSLRVSTSRPLTLGLGRSRPGRRPREQYSNPFTGAEGPNRDDAAGSSTAGSSTASSSSSSGAPEVPEALSVDGGAAAQAASGGGADGPAAANDPGLAPIPAFRNHRGSGSAAADAPSALPTGPTTGFHSAGSSSGCGAAAPHSDKAGGGSRGAVAGATATSSSSTPIEDVARAVLGALPWGKLAAHHAHHSAGNAGGAERSSSSGAASSSKGATSGGHTGSNGGLARRGSSGNSSSGGSTGAPAAAAGEPASPGSASRPGSPPGGGTPEAAGREGVAPGLSPFSAVVQGVSGLLSTAHSDGGAKPPQQTDAAVHEAAPAAAARSNDRTIADEDEEAEPEAPYSSLYERGVGRHATMRERLTLAGKFRRGSTFPRHARLAIPLSVRAIAPLEQPSTAQPHGAAALPAGTNSTSTSTSSGRPSSSRGRVAGAQHGGAQRSASALGLPQYDSGMSRDDQLAHATATLAALDPEQQRQVQALMDFLRGTPPPGAADGGPALHARRPELPERMKVGHDAVIVVQSVRVLEAVAAAWHAAEVPLMHPHYRGERRRPPVVPRTSRDAAPRGAREAAQGRSGAPFGGAGPAPAWLQGPLAAVAKRLSGK